MKKRITTVLFALLALVFILFSGCPQEIIKLSAGQSRESGMEIRMEEKIFWTGTIDEDFDGSSVMVVMDKNTGGVNKVHDKSFFGNIEIESIEDLTIFTGNIDEKGLDWEI